MILTDYAENMLKMAIIDDDKVLASFDALPFRDNAFDVVMSSFALHASDNIEIVIKEITRVSRKIVGFIAMGKPDNPIKRIYLSLYLRFVMPYIAALAGLRLEISNISTIFTEDLVLIRISDQFFINI